MTTGQLHKLAMRHTEAGITVDSDDHCVSLRYQGMPLRFNDGSLAIWLQYVTITEMVAVADKWLAEQEAHQ